MKYWNKRKKMLSDDSIFSFYGKDASNRNFLFHKLDFLVKSFYNELN